MLPGVFSAKKKDGTIYYRSSITYQTKHISLGSYPTEESASLAYYHALEILSDSSLLFDHYDFSNDILSFEKIVVLFNFRDNHLYLPNPIYLKNRYFIYFLSPDEQYKFDIDDLFYYANHKIIRRKGHLFVNDYGMQITILSRYGIKPYSVLNRDYYFVNGDCLDYRYSNIQIINPYQGVLRKHTNGITSYHVSIHINGNYKVGVYSTLEEAAVAYNKAVDFAKHYGITKNFTTNYISELTPSKYAQIYSSITLSSKYISYLKGLLY